MTREELAAASSGEKPDRGHFGGVVLSLSALVLGTLALVAVLNNAITPNESLPPLAAALTAALWGSYKMRKNRPKND